MIRLSDVQPYVVQKIEAAPALAAFGTPLAFSLHLNDETQRNAISERIRNAGVCIEVSAVLVRPGTTNGSGTARGLFNWSLYVAEKVGGAHSPSDTALVDAVITAVIDQDPSTPEITCTEYDAVVTENGYVLHVLTFEMPTVVG